MFPFQKDPAKEIAEVTAGCIGALTTLVYRVAIGAAAVKVLFFL